ncbi:MAG: IS200/IS605 family transposase [Gemmatimonadota bacterium]
MHHRLFIHLVWTTRDRAPLIDLARAQFLVAYLPIVSLQERGTICAIGIVSTHVHVLLQVDPVLALPRLVQRFKGGSSTLASQQCIGNRASPLRWARGYSAKSVSDGAVGKVVQYIESQALHHPTEAIADWVAPSTLEILSV